MKSVLLCEGKTDAILISYYLNSIKGWTCCAKEDKRKVKLPIRNSENEELNWYTLDDNLLAIWGVGGKDNFSHAIERILKMIKLGAGETFTKIIILTDRDVEEDDFNILKNLGAYLGKDNLSNNEWTQKEYINEFKSPVVVKILPIVIPFNRKGAIETFVLEGIEEMGEEESCIINSSKKYVASFNLKKYLNTQGLKVKAELSVSLSTLFPQKTFTPIDRMLKEIKWEKYKNIQKGFSKLEEI